MLKIRQSDDRLIFNMGIPMPEKWSLYWDSAQHSVIGGVWITVYSQKTPYISPMGMRYGVFFCPNKIALYFWLLEGNDLFSITNLEHVLDLKLTKHVCFRENRPYFDKTHCICGCQRWIIHSPSGRNLRNQGKMGSRFRHHEAPWATKYDTACLVSRRPTID